MFKCVYTDWEKPVSRLGDPFMGNYVFHLLYAESEDGSHWEKLTFNIHKVNRVESNIIVPNTYNMT